MHPALRAVEEGPPTRATKSPHGLAVSNQYSHAHSRTFIK